MNQKVHSALMVAFHLATNSLSLRSFSALSSLLGSRIVDVDAFMKATMLRAAHVTIKDVDVWYEYLMSMARWALPVSLFTVYKTQVAGWDSPPMIVNLMQALAFEKFDNNKRVELEDALNAWLNKPKSIGLQRRFYEVLCVTDDNSFCGDLNCRLLQICPDYAGDTESAFKFLKVSAAPLPPLVERC